MEETQNTPYENTIRLPHKEQILIKMLFPKLDLAGNIDRLKKVNVEELKIKQEEAFRNNNFIKGFEVLQSNSDNIPKGSRVTLSLRAFEQMERNGTTFIPKKDGNYQLAVVHESSVTWIKIG